MLNVGFVVTVSGRWPRELPGKRLKEYSLFLQKAAYPDVNLIIFPALVDTPQALEEVVQTFSKERVDVVIQLYGAFTGDDVCTALYEGLRSPVILWAPYEPPFEREDRLYANALVAATMNAASMHRLGYPCHVLYGGSEDERIARQLSLLIRAYAVKKRLSGTRLGLLGYRPTAFYNSAFDEGLIRRTFGVRMEETDLKVVFDRMAALPQEQVETEMKKVQEAFSDIDLPEGHLENHARLAIALKQVIGEAGYGYSVIKCWPEMGNLKATPCAVMGRLADEEVLIGCEGDVDAMLALMAENLLTGLPGFVTDMINIDEQENTMTFWHCGNAAPSLFHPKDKALLRNHPLAGQGSAFWTALKPGKVTIARFCNIGGSYKLLLLKGEALDTRRNTRGTMVNVRVEKPVRSILQGIFDKGVPHHYTLVWKDVAEEMAQLCQLLDVEVLDV